MRPCVLAIDDNVLVLAAVRLALEEAGYDVLTASAARDLAIDPRLLSLVVLDLQMPDQRGDDVARLLRRVGAYAVPLVFYSSVGRDELAARAAAARVAAAVHKADGVGALVACVRALVPPVAAA